MRRMALYAPALNGIRAELALAIERQECQELVSDRIPGKLTSLPDWCSRLHSRGATRRSRQPWKEPRSVVCRPQTRSSGEFGTWLWVRLMRK